MNRRLTVFTQWFAMKKMKHNDCVHIETEPTSRLIFYFKNERGEIFEWKQKKSRLLFIYRIAVTWRWKRPLDCTQARQRWQHSHKVSNILWNSVTSENAIFTTLREKGGWRGCYWFDYENAGWHPDLWRQPRHSIVQWALVRRRLMKWTAQVAPGSLLASCGIPQMPAPRCARSS